MKKNWGNGNFFSFFEIHSAWVKMGNFIPKIGPDRVYFNKILSFQQVKSWFIGLSIFGEIVINVG